MTGFMMNPEGCLILDGHRHRRRKIVTPIFSEQLRQAAVEFLACHGVVGEVGVNEMQKKFFQWLWFVAKLLQLHFRESLLTKNRQPRVWMGLWVPQKIVESVLGSHKKSWATLPLFVLSTRRMSEPNGHDCK